MFLRQTIHITVIQVYVLTSNVEEAEVEQFYEDLHDLLELTPQKDVLFIIGDWSAKLSRSKAKRVLPREYTGHCKYPLPTTQDMTLHMDITK